jgi:hypothetical protein
VALQEIDYTVISVAQHPTQVGGVTHANITAECLETQFRAHDLFDCARRRHVHIQVEALLATVSEEVPVNFRSFDVFKDIQSFKLLS